MTIRREFLSGGRSIPVFFIVFVLAPAELQILFYIYIYITDILRVFVIGIRWIWRHTTESKGMKENQNCM